MLIWKIIPDMQQRHAETIAGINQSHAETIAKLIDDCKDEKKAIRADNRRETETLAQVASKVKDWGSDKFNKVMEAVRDLRQHREGESQ